MTSGSTLSDVRRSSKEAKRWLKSPTTSWCHPFKALDAIWFQHCLNSNCIFPECVARVPVSLWGSGGWGCVKLDVALASAPIRNGSRDCYMAVPMVSSAGVVIFGGFKRLVASFRVASVALRDIQMCFVTCRKLFCVAGAILLRRFQKMRCSFRGRRSTLDVSIVIFRGRRNTLDVSCWVFFANRIGSGHKLQIPWQAWHFLTCAENWRKPRTKHRFWGCKIWRFLRKLVGKRRFWSYKVWKLEEVSHEMLVLVLPPVSSRVTGFLVASPCLWGKLQNMSFRHVSNCENWRKSRTKCVFSFAASMCLVSSLWFSCGAAVSMGEAARPLLFEGFQASCHAVLRGRRGTLWHSNLFANVSKMSKLEEVSYEMCVFICCIHVSCLESLVFLWRRRVYGGSCKTSPLRRFPSKLSCRFAWQAWHFVTFQPLC